MDCVEPFKLIIIIVVLHCDGSCLIFDNILLCEQSSIDFICPNETIITDVNISTPTSTVNENVCATMFDTAVTSDNERVIQQCIGKSSCTILGTDVDFTQISDQTWKLTIEYTCNRSRSLNSKYKERTIICPYGLHHVRCRSSLRKINIVYAKLETKHSVCNPIDENMCVDVIKNRIKDQCNGNQQCNEIENRDIDWKFCIRIPKNVYVSFMCSAVDHVINIPHKDDNSISDKEIGLVVGVTLAFIMIVSVCFVLVVKRLAVNRNRQIVIYQNTGGQRNTKETVTNDTQDNYTSLQQRRDVSNYMELENVSPKEMSTNDHTYMDVL